LKSAKPAVFLGLWLFVVEILANLQTLTAPNEDLHILCCPVPHLHIHAFSQNLNGVKQY
jgi:hypothetical protein